MVIQKGISFYILKLKPFRPKIRGLIMTSYQRRKREIFYLEQCISELEDITRELAIELRENAIRIPLLSQGISGDTLITPYNNGDFVSHL